MGKRRIAFLLATLLLIHIVLPLGMANAAAAQSGGVQLDAKSAILMDAGTGQILYEMNADVALPPASMSKMMTEYLVLEKIKSGALKWEDMVTASKYAAGVVGSGQMIAENEQLTVKQMFQAMSIYSSNDASIALAEHIGGTEEAFAKMMNDTAKKLGMSDQAHFINATGLSRQDIAPNDPKGIQGETMLTAKDCAILAYHLIKEHKEVLEFTKIPALKLRSSDKSPMLNWNYMLESNTSVTNFKQYAYQGLDGLKTGHTNEAGYCFTGTAERNGMRLISVVMGTPSEPKRFQESRKVLDYGFNSFEKKNVVAAGSTVESLKKVNVNKGVKTSVPVVTGSDVTLVVKKGAKDSEFVKTTKPIDESKLVAPLKKGDQVGTMKVTYNGHDTTVKLVAAEDVKKASWIRLFFRSIGHFFGNLFGSIKKLF
jgi:D-alanyl-D-alanine carboxypeptidase (penicillin-binding protein 5/6)